MLSDATTRIAVLTPLLDTLKSAWPWCGTLFCCMTFTLKPTLLMLRGTLWRCMMWSEIIDIKAPESGTALIWNSSPPYKPFSHNHKLGIGFGGASKSMICPSTSTWPAGRTIGRLCSELDAVLVAIDALIILMGSEVAFCVMVSCPGIGVA